MNVVTPVIVCAFLSVKQSVVVQVTSPYGAPSTQNALLPQLDCDIDACHTRSL